MDNKEELIQKIVDIIAYVNTHKTSDDYEYEEQTHFINRFNDVVNDLEDLITWVIEDNTL